jgi:hypothetical protein
MREKLFKLLCQDDKHNILAKQSVDGHISVLLRKCQISHNIEHSCLLQVFDASNCFSFVYDDKKTLYAVVSCESGIIQNDPDR